MKYFAGKEPSIVPFEIRNAISLEEFSAKIKSWRPELAFLLKIFQFVDLFVFVFFYGVNCPYNIYVTLQNLL